MVSTTPCWCLRQVPQQRNHIITWGWIKVPNTGCLFRVEESQFGYPIAGRVRVCGRPLTRLRSWDRDSLVEIGAKSGRHHVCRLECSSLAVGKRSRSVARAAVTTFEGRRAAKGRGQGRRSSVWMKYVDGLGREVMAASWLIGRMTRLMLWAGLTC